MTSELTRRMVLAGAGAGVFCTALAAGGPARAAIAAFRMALAEATLDDPGLAAFYRARDFAPFFTADDPARRQALAEALAAAPAHGLPAARHDPQRLIAIFREVRTGTDLGRAEIAAARMFVDFARDMESGVIADPGGVDGGIKRRAERAGSDTLLERFAATGARGLFTTLPPQSGEYARLMAEKRRLEQVIAAGGWGPAVPARKLEPGDSGRAVVALRDRLIAMGYLAPTARGDYSNTLALAVQSFQLDHGLEADAIAGAGTLDAINTAPEDRLGAVIVAMERERWLPRDRGRRHVLVNIPDFRAMIVDDDRVTFSTRSVVGKNSAGRRTPEFSDIMEHMIVNPSWYVPRSITVNEYLPQLRANPSAERQLQVIDGAGRVVPRGAVDFSKYSARTFPYSLKEPPSSGNALGLVKFRFPNRYNIYLHDTPAKSLFAYNKRDFSHGCIRLNDPFDFAYALLGPQTSDPRGMFHRALETGRTTQLDLTPQIPVHLIYRTAVTKADGRVQYRDDVYGRDASLFAALRAAGVAPGLRTG